MNTIEKGNITELEMQLALVRKNLLVFTPINDGCFVDLVVKLKDGYRSVQIKTARKTATGFRINLYSSSGGKCKRLYNPNDLDYFGTFFDDKIYLIPLKDVIGRFELTLRFSDLYKNQNKCFLASKYEV